MCATVEKDNISSDSELRFSSSESDIDIDQTPDAPESEVRAAKVQENLGVRCIAIHTLY